MVRAFRRHLQVLARIPLLALLLFVASPLGLGQAIATTIDPCCDPPLTQVAVPNCEDTACAAESAAPCSDAGETIGQATDTDAPDQTPAQDDSKGPCCEVSVASFMAILAVDIALPHLADQPVLIPACLSPGSIVIRPLLNPPQA